MNIQSATATSVAYNKHCGDDDDDDDDRTIIEAGEEEEESEMSIDLLQTTPTSIDPGMAIEVSNTQGINNTAPKDIEQSLCATVACEEPLSLPRSLQRKNSLSDSPKGQHSHTMPMDDGGAAVTFEECLSPQSQLDAFSQLDALLCSQSANGYFESQLAVDTIPGTPDNASDNSLSQQRTVIEQAEELTSKQATGKRTSEEINTQHFAAPMSQQNTRKGGMEQPEPKAKSQKSKKKQQALLLPVEAYYDILKNADSVSLTFLQKNFSLTELLAVLRRTGYMSEFSNKRTACKFVVRLWSAGVFNKPCPSSSPEPHPQTPLTSYHHPLVAQSTSYDERHAHATTLNPARVNPYTAQNPLGSGRPSSAILLQHAITFGALWQDCAPVCSMPLERLRRLCTNTKCQHK